MICYLAKAMKDGNLIFIDEIDAKFHPHLLEYMLTLYQDSQYNKNGSQLVFTMNNSHIIENQKIFRRDQLIIVNKNEFGESSVNRIHTTENPIRNDQSRVKEYLEGRKGGISKKLKIL
ncbi:MAG: ATP-binding protein [Bacteroidetes bacterium]|nr:ATP-binding protein [Bacteroidota bacterium]